MQTRAVVISEPGKVLLQDVQLKSPGPDDVVIATAFTSISAGTERMLLAGKMQHPMQQLPVIPGYETVGRVTEVGENVDASLNGQWVYVGGSFCYKGINAAWGGQSQTLIAPAERIVPLENVDPRTGVLLALAATSLHGVDVLEVKEGDQVLVLGQGPVGQIAARIARARGAWVAVADRSPERLQHAEGDLVITVDDHTVLSEVLPDAVDAIIEATGSMQALTSALPVLKNGGTILLLGYYTTLELPYMPLFLKEARLLTAKEWAPGDLQRCRNMIADGSLNVTPLLTHDFSIADVATAYDTAMNDMDCLKLVLNWNL